MRATVVSLALAAVVLTAGPARAQEAPFSIQAAVNAAAPGDVVEIPPGTYFESVALPDGVAVAGAGADQTVIDGNGADTVVTSGRDSILSGVTVRNGKICIANAGRSMGIFDCRIEGYGEFGIRLDNGCAVIVNNLVAGHDKAKGIACFGSNPYIVNNVILSNHTGVLVWQHYVPTIQQNVFAGNVVAIHVGGEAFALLGGNVFDRNHRDIIGQDLTDTDVIRPAGSEELALRPAGGLDGYRKLMDLVLDEKIQKHPSVIYDLFDEPGRFGVITLFPWASFTVGASAVDTVIADFDAYDWVTKAVLQAQYADLGRPSVVVKNDELKDKELDRYVLENLYIHPASYLADEQGRLRFRRMTNMSRIEIICPAGYIPGALNYPATFSWEQGQVVVHIRDVGQTDIDLTLDPAAGAADPYGLLAGR